MKRIPSLIVLGLLCVGFALPAVEAREETVSKAQFFERTAAVLYGSLKREYSVPYEGVPASAQSAVGLARVLGVVRQDLRNWNASISRGEALEMLFGMAKIAPAAGEGAVFRDVRTQTAGRAATQALRWNLLSPRTPRYFGWGRALTQQEFDYMLQNLQARISLPLDEPTVGEDPVRARRTRGRPPLRSREQYRKERESQPAQRNGQPQQIQIEFFLDTGSRSRSSIGGPRKRELPKKDLLETVWGLIQSRFLYDDRIDQDELAYKIAEEMVKSLQDPYSAFLRPKKAQSFMQSIQGELSGIGAQVQAHKLGGVEIVTPLPGSPAMAAGVRPGDRVTHVNGKDLTGLSFQEAVENIRGPVGSIAELNVEREGGNLKIAVVRDKINLAEIIVTEQEDVVVIKLVQFGQKVREGLMAAIEEAKAKNAAGIVLDLRNNPGGLLDAAIDVASHFLPESAVVARIKSKGQERIETVRSGTKPLMIEKPMVVLVNKGSASASEIVAGALQDHGRATVVGQTTFGKGTVQEVLSLNGGESVKLTIAEWLTPLGRLIQDKGVVPDREIAENAQGGRDEMLLEAIRMVKRAR